MNLIKSAAYTALGMIAADSARANLVLAPVAAGGVLIGVRATRWAFRVVFFRLAYTLVAVASAKLICNALA